MKPKKTKKADLNNYSSTFMLIGLVVVLFVTLQTINLKTFASEIAIDSFDPGTVTMDETTVVKIEEPKPKVKIEKPKELVKLDIKKDDEKIVEDLFKTSEVKDKDSIIPIDEIDTGEVESAPEITVDFKLVEEVPVFPGCKGNRKQLKKCMNEKIRQLVAKNFNTELAQDLGLSGEKVRIFTQFTIDKNGQISEIKTRSKYKDLEKEAEKVIRKFPKMKPGKQRGRPVKVTYVLPIVFKVADE